MKSMLLVMDMMNDLVHPGGVNAKTCVVQAQGRALYANTVRAIAAARAAAVPVGYVRVGFSPDYRECPPASPIFSKARDARLFKLGSWGTEVYPEFAPHPGDFDIVKHRVSPFYGASLEPILRAHGIGRLVLCGVSTNGVVQGPAREGHDRDYACTILEDCCCGATAEEHDFALAGLRRFAEITTSTAVTFH
jgi:nicotinamidase-related amidase